MLWLSPPAISIIPQYLLLNKRNYVNSESSIQSVKEPYHIIHGSCIMCTFSDELTSLESSDASNATPYQKMRPLWYICAPGTILSMKSSEHRKTRHPDGWLVFLRLGIRKAASKNLKNGFKNMEYGFKNKD